MSPMPILLEGCGPYRGGLPFGLHVRVIASPVACKSSCLHPAATAQQQRHQQHCVPDWAMPISQRQHVTWQVSRAGQIPLADKAAIGNASPGARKHNRTGDRLLRCLCLNPPVGLFVMKSIGSLIHLAEPAAPGCSLNSARLPCLPGLLSLAQGLE